MAVQSELVAAVGEALRPLAFRRRTFNWFRAGDGLYSVVNVQKSAWGDGVCYLNIGLSLPDRVERGWLPESRCFVRFRFEALRSAHPQDSRLLDQHSLDTMGLTAWGLAVADRVARPIADLLAEATDVPTLRNALDSRLSAHVFVHKEAQRMLAPLAKPGTSR